MPFETVVSYNPMSCIQSGRMEDIHTYFSQEEVSVLGLQGTRFKQKPGLPFETMYCGDNFVILAGYGTYSNKHSGVSLSFHIRKIPELAIISIDYPTDRLLQGRAIFTQLFMGTSIVVSFAMFLQNLVIFVQTWYLVPGTWYLVLGT